jgi:hypothetical protein
MLSRSAPKPHSEISQLNPCYDQKSTKGESFRGTSRESAPAASLFAR